VGFELIGFDGRNSILARVGQASPYRAGKYGVNLRGFEEFLSGMDLSNSPGLAIIDEIGKMECYSSIFRELVQDLLTSPTIILATIAQRGDSFIEEIKQRNDVQVFHVIRENRNELPEAITREIRALMEDSRR
jgi:nucleoside-triphosphatase